MMQVSSDFHSKEDLESFCDLPLLDGIQGMELELEANSKGGEFQICTFEVFVFFYWDP